MSPFTGTGRLLRLALRRDRLQLPIWLVVLTLVQYASTVSVIDLYRDDAARLAFTVTSAESPVLLVFNGLISGSGLGAVAASQTLLIVVLGAAFMSLFAIIRHTRQNEETGRAELIGSAVVGRHAALTAALLLVIGANVVLGLLNAVALIAADLPAAGAFAEGAAIALAGIAFASAAAVCAQIPEGARSANGLAAGFVGVAFLLRSIGDVTGHVTEQGTKVISGWASWLSPIGWAQQVRPFDDDKWWVLGLMLGFSALAVGGAFVLTTRRDVGFGLSQTRPGPPQAPPGLLSPLGLAWRLQRGTLLGWSVGMIVVALALGAVGDAVRDVVESSDTVAEIVEQLGGGGANLIDNYFAAVFGLLGLAIGGYAVQALLRLRSEESGPLEPLLATAVSRPRWLASHVAIVVAGTVFLLALAGACTGLFYGLVVGDVGGYVGDLTVAALVQTPAALALVGFVVAAFGLLPRLTAAIAWAGFGICLLLGQIGALLKLPQAILNISPFSHTPPAPVADVAVQPLVVLLAVAALLTGAGFVLFRRRDLAM
ncbi:ABC transporter permease [Micromonospora sp. NPDC048898]|uniref:ABC transporter permease n=1 Tax=Micromonospora sp. NPDC048898 TaxID=3364260 RepID=UPI0037233B7B